MAARLGVRNLAKPAAAATTRASMVAKGRQPLNPVPLYDEAEHRAFLEGMGLRTDLAERHSVTIRKHALFTLLQSNGDPAKVDVASVEKVPKVAKGAAALERFSPLTSTVVHEDWNAKGDTLKLLIRLQDGHHVEAVCMLHDKRNTVCVSSQIGCKMGCKFCATGKLGELGNLTGGEVVEQVIHASVKAGVRVTNVVFMGQGEPLNNFEAVKCAVRTLTDRRLFSLSPRRVTVSTVGVTSKIRAMTEELPGVSLALSLHAPNQELRKKVVPSANANPLEGLLEEVDQWLEKHGDGPHSRLMIEYCVIHNLNDSDECARELGKKVLPNRHHAFFNLIPLNESDSLPGLQAPSEERLQSMLRVLSRECGRLTTVRHEMGQDIDGACGQLSLKYDPSQASSGSTIDIEDASGPDSATSKAKPRVKPRPKKAKAGNEPPSEGSSARGSQAQRNRGATISAKRLASSSGESAYKIGMGVAGAGLGVAATLWQMGM